MPATDATDWARRNKIDPRPRDFHISNVDVGEAVQVAVPRSAEPYRLENNHNGRRNNFFD